MGRRTSWRISWVAQTRPFPHPSLGVQHCLQGLQPSSRSLVCYHCKHETTIVCVTGSRCHDVEWGHLSTFLGRSHCLHIPPFTLLRQVLSRVMALANLSSILVAPLWPQKEWFADLLAVLVEEPLGLLLLWYLLIYWTSEFHWGLRCYSFMLESYQASCPQGWLFGRGCRGHCFEVQRIHTSCLPGKMVSFL